MNFDGSTYLPIDESVLRAQLADVNVLRRVIPGCVQLYAIEPGEYRIQVQQRLGNFDDRLDGILSLQHLPYDEIGFEAHLEGSHGLVNLAGQLELISAGETGSMLTYDGDIELEGGLAAVSPRMLETTVKAYVRRTLEALQAEFSAPTSAAREETNMNDTPPEQKDLVIALPPWALVLLLGLAGVIALRLLDNRRINRLRSSNSTATSSGSGRA